MSGAPLPGRPDNLTAEQEEKLREFWIALFNVFGIPDVSEAHGSDGGKTTGQNAQKDNEALNKDKKKSRGLFGRKHVDVAADGTEDKYGQTKEFQKIVENQSPEELRESFWSMVKADNPDALLLRFLRARKWNVANALAMLIATVQWRLAELKVDSDIMMRGEGGAWDDSQSKDAAIKREGHDFIEQMRLGKSFLHGTDKDGRPICFVRVKLHRAGEQTEKSLERYTVFTIETARLLLHDNVDTATIVFDMTDFSMANMDYTPVKFMIKVFEANYPESLGVVLVHKSPWIFQSIWKIIKGWLDPVVAAKIHFTKDTDELSHFVPLDHIPPEMGGKEPWSYAYIPPAKDENTKLDETATRDALLERRVGQVKDYEAATKRWLSDKSSEADTARKEVVEQLRVGYWELDPYLRARSFYDRTGVIQPGGKLDFYPYAKKEAVPNGGPIPSGHDDDGVD